MTHRWYLLDSDIVGDGFRALCYQDDTLVESTHFDNRWVAIEHGEQWVYSESMTFQHSDN